MTCSRAKKPHIVGSNIAESGYEWRLNCYHSIFEDVYSCYEFCIQQLSNISEECFPIAQNYVYSNCYTKLLVVDTRLEVLEDVNYLWNLCGRDEVNPTLSRCLQKEDCRCCCLIYARGSHPS